jgi:DNA repair exonuclease SbcCD nuclease subunit
MRFAHIADTHLGYRQYNLDEREADFYRVFHQAVDKIVEHRCEFVLHSGDLFDSPRPHIRAMLEVMKGLERLSEEGITVYAIAGNHDVLLRRGAVPPHRLYKSIEFLTPRNPSRVHGGVFICGLPYHSRIHSGSLQKHLRGLAEQARRHETRIIMLHQGIDKYFPLEHELKIGELPKVFHYYAMGHIHKRVLDRFGQGVIAYPGSPEIWRVDELQDWKSQGKGFYLVDTRGFEVSRVDLDVRPFVRAEISSMEDILGLRDSIQLASRPVVRVTVSAGPEEYNRLYQELLRQLKHALYLDITRKRVEEVEEAEAAPISIRELIMETMKDHSGPEKTLAYVLFEALSTGDLETAREAVKDFYSKWTPGRKQSPGKRQAQLEVFE